MRISIDFETYSEADIRKLGAWAYSVHPSTEVLCMAYSIDGAEPQLWLPTEPPPWFVTGNAPLSCIAWNVGFEYAIWHNVLGWPSLPITQWEDTAAHAAALALPRALGDCAVVLGLPADQQKDKRGKYLIQRLCKPFGGFRNTNFVLLDELYDYCKQDVVTEMAVAAKVLPLNETERKVWELDQTINVRGVPVDRQAVIGALKIIDTVTRELNNEVYDLTGGVLSNVSQVAAVKDYAGALGCPMEGFDKNYIAEFIQGDIPQKLKRVLEIRQQLGKTSTAKYSAFELLTRHAPRVHGVLLYHGAATGRWAGRLVQPQNFPRGNVNDSDTCIDIIRTGDAKMLEMMYDEPMEALSSCLRGVICADEGKRLIVADYSAIEARVLAWLAGQQDIIDVFKGDGKVYELAASQIYGVPLTEVTKDQRFIGKVAVLALGYQGGKKAFIGMAQNYG
ncbi:MAG: XRE family transcriptional regulator, partial [Chloroflexia bacterium]|nr:XRE family transcriptional regulator [Chloroflexia bacterium]